MKIGAQYLGGGKCEFTVWAPFRKNVGLKIVYPYEHIISMKQHASGYWKASADEVSPGALYLYRLDRARERPDPASFSQPQGVHGPSEVIDHARFRWEDEKWSGIPLEKMIIYELHVGTFTPQGTILGIIPRLDELIDLGINAIEIMPVAQFPGERNWGYDGVYPFAVQNSYGGSEGLKELVNAAHKHGLGVILDVVYNHLGPEGNYLQDFGSYFTTRYKTPWGSAINFDDAHNDEVRNFFLENALYWFGVYHIDALRLDAIHGIYDMSAKPFLQELAEAVEEYSRERGRKFYLMAESDLNDARVIRPKESGGYGIDTQWNDDFHHSLHTLLTGEEKGYYLDFGRTEHLVKALREGFVYSWQYSPYRKRRHGSSSQDRPAYQFIICSQNHDQVGNRMLGERLSAQVNFEGLKLAAGAVLTLPYVPLLFMGEEYGEESPFLYFVSHSDPALIQSVREGRSKEFQALEWHSEPPDPQSVDTFMRSKLRWELRTGGKHKVLLDFYRELIKLRKGIPALANSDKDCLEVSPLKKEKILLVSRWHAESQVLIVMSFCNRDIPLPFSFPQGKWRRAIDSSDTRWMGPGSFMPEIAENTQELTLRPLSLVLYQMETQYD